MLEASAMAVHPSGAIIATAERAFHAKIFVWDLSTLATLKILKGHKNGVSAMAFSQDGKR
jgi:WD40 repeat protein